MFNNCDSKTNGEQLFYKNIQDKIKVIFDVGVGAESEFVTFEGEVHYFDPVSEYIDNLSRLPKSNRVSYFNHFGLGNSPSQSYYYPRFQSFYNRINSCHVDDGENKILLQIRRGVDYVEEKKIEKIDFLKIDTEGCELSVLQGFDYFLENVQFIQFEYGGTFLDNNTQLIDVVNYLQKMGFYNFAYLTEYGTEIITDFTDHYQYCNIVCINKNSDFVPY